MWLFPGVFINWCKSCAIWEFIWPLVSWVNLDLNPTFPLVEEVQSHSMTVGECLDIRSLMASWALVPQRLTGCPLLLTWISNCSCIVCLKIWTKAFVNMWFYRWSERLGDKNTSLIILPCSPGPFFSLQHLLLCLAGLSLLFCPPLYSLSPDPVLLARKQHILPLPHA